MLLETKLNSLPSPSPFFCPLTSCYNVKLQQLAGRPSHLNYGVATSLGKTDDHKNLARNLDESTSAPNLYSVTLVCGRLGHVQMNDHYLV